MEQRGGRHRVGGLAVRTPGVEADVGGHAQPDIRRGRFQRELDATAVKVLPGSGPSVTVARWPTASPASTLSGTSQIASMSPDHANW
ncbi:hypothetical protein G6F61_014935 [Rhizopus arrhizus]|nr:hypothetical protein G6F61_014935 [Rhizopus arrhizus]